MQMDAKKVNSDLNYDEYDSKMHMMGESNVHTNSLRKLPEFGLDISKIKAQMRMALDELQEVAQLTPGKILVIGCSTSEVIGERIGTSGTAEVAESLFEVFSEFQAQSGVKLAFQCCEHLNRAIVIDQETADAKGFEPVSVIPVRKAGGAMAAYAYRHLENAIVVEFIKADAGIDIGDTLIGMHLKHVAVPVRSQVKKIGQAHLNLATTRPKLIGGERAVYSDLKVEKKCNG